jgi:hypothetical protein
MRDLSNKNIIQINKDGLIYIQFKKLLDLGIKHSYSLKNEKMDIRKKGGNPETEKESYKRLCEAVGLNVENLSRPDQQHTDKVEIIKEVQKKEELKNIDGLITNQKNIVLATTNADCILYLVYDPKNKVIANVHSGWRGTYQRIIEKTIDKMISEFGSNPEDIIICICPSIRRCCFEVDKDVKDMFQEKFSFLENIEKFIVNGYVENKFYIDTVGINNCLLQNKGIKKENIYDSGICSVCNSDLVHSYRVEKNEFKLATAIISL